MSKSEIMSHHIQEWEASKTSAKTYCQEAGLNLSVFYYWRKKLTSQQEPSSDFILLKPEEPKTKNEIVIKYPNGIEINVPCESQITLIRSLIQL